MQYVRHNAIVKGIFLHRPRLYQRMCCFEIAINFITQYKEKWKLNTVFLWTYIEYNFVISTKLIFSYTIFMFMSIKVCFTCNNTFCKNNEVLWSFSSLLLDSTSSTKQAQLATQGPWCQVAEDILVAVTNSLLVGCAECCSGSNEVVYVSVTWLGYRKSRWFDFFFRLWRTLF